MVDNFHFEYIFLYIEQILNITFGDLFATPIASGMKPFAILPDDVYLLALVDTN